MSTLIDLVVQHAWTGVGVLAILVLIGVLANLGRHLIPKRPEKRKHGRILVWGTALGASTVLAVVVVFTQVPFYKELFGQGAEPLPWLNLAYLTPIALESLAWVFTVMSVFAVVNNKPSGRYERLMWVLSSVAAVVNAGHNISTGKAVTGLVLGGFSVAGPLLVHYALRWDRDSQSDWSAEDFRKAAVQRAVRTARRVAQVGRHPVTSWHAMSIATDLGCSWDTAYRIALTGSKDAVHAVLADQVRRSMPAVHTVEVEDRRGRLGRALRPAPRPRTEVVHDEIEPAVHDEAGEEITPVCTDPLIADLAAVQSPDDLTRIWSRARVESSEDDRAQDGVHDGVHGSGNGRARQPEHGVHGVQNDAEHGVHEPSQDRARPRAQRGAQDRARTKRQRAPQSSETRARKVVHASAERQDETAARFWLAARRRGVDISALTRAQVVERIGINNTTAVSRGFAKAESGEFVDPGEQPDERDWFGEA